MNKNSWKPNRFLLEVKRLELIKIVTKEARAYNAFKFFNEIVDRMIQLESIISNESSDIYHKIHGFMVEMDQSFFMNAYAIREEESDRSWLFSQKNLELIDLLEEYCFEYIQNYKALSYPKLNKEKDKRYDESLDVHHDLMANILKEAMSLEDQDLKRKIVQILSNINLQMRENSSIDPTNYLEDVLSALRNNTLTIESIDFKRTKHL